MTHIVTQGRAGRTHRGPQAQGRAAAALADTFVTLVGLAGWLGVGAKTTAGRVVDSEGFPASVVTGGPLSRRWPSAALDAWAMAASLGGVFTAEAARVSLGALADASAADGDAVVDPDARAERYGIGRSKAYKLVASEGFPRSLVAGT